MRIKNYLITAYLVLLAATANAQAYTIKPVYVCKTVTINGTEVRLYSIDTFSRGSFIVDLDKMTFTNPVTIMSAPEIITIKKVTRLENNLFKLKLKKDNKYSPDLYYLQLDAAGNPVYLQKDDIIFTTYTTTASALTLTLKCSRVQKVTVPYRSGEAAPDDTLRKAMAAIPYSEGYNKFELNNGTVTWTEGKGKNTVVHTITVSSSLVSTNKNNYYIQLIGKDEVGLDYNVMFFNTAGHYPTYDHMFVERMENNSWIAMSFY